MGKNWGGGGGGDVRMPVATTFHVENQHFARDVAHAINGAELNPIDWFTTFKGYVVKEV
jgi:hypothetical protein